MRSAQKIIEDVIEIYRESGVDAEEYLHKARRLKEEFGAGLVIVYCWFYSVPQKWTQVEPKIFKLMKHTNSFDLKSTSKISKEDLATILKSMIFSNEISLQLKNFCKAIQDEYGSWEDFAEILENEDIFSIFKRLRRHQGIRLTFKNLAAMKAFIGLSNDFFILDTHVAKVFGIRKAERNKYRVQEKLYKDLLALSNKITHALERKGFSEITTIKWSLAIWFNKAKIHANDLLTNVLVINKKRP